MDLWQCKMCKHMNGDEDIVCEWCGEEKQPHPSPQAAEEQVTTVRQYARKLGFSDPPPDTWKGQVLPTEDGEPVAIGDCKLDSFVGRECEQLMDIVKLLEKKMTNVVKLEPEAWGAFIDLVWQEMDIWWRG